MNDTVSKKVTLILPVRRADEQVIKCLRSVLGGTVVPEIFLMDCTATPGALSQVRREYPQVHVFDLGMNPGRAHAVNTGIHVARTPFVMTLSPRLAVGKHCIERLCAALDQDGTLLSAQAGILSRDDASRMSGAGWCLDLSANPFIRGEGGKASAYQRRKRIAAAQMEAAVYRMEYLEVTGIFDERYYGRMEDLDLGYRGGICGFFNLYEPGAVCRELESSAGSSFYNQLETGNLVYFRYKYGLDPLWDKLSRVFGAKKDPAQREAVERGQMLCFQAEMERMEREELGMTVTKQTLPEEFCLQVKEDGPGDVYPLYLGERVDSPLSEPLSYLRGKAAMMGGTAEKVRNLFHSFELI